MREHCYLCQKQTDLWQTFRLGRNRIGLCLVCGSCTKALMRGAWTLTVQSGQETYSLHGTETEKSL